MPKQTPITLSEEVVNLAGWEFTICRCQSRLTGRAYWVCHPVGEPRMEDKSRQGLIAKLALLPRPANAACRQVIQTMTPPAVEDLRHAYCGVADGLLALVESLEAACQALDVGHPALPYVQAELILARQMRDLQSQSRLGAVL